MFYGIFISLIIANGGWCGKGVDLPLIIIESKVAKKLQYFLKFFKKIYFIILLSVMNEVKSVFWDFVLDIIRMIKKI